MNPALTIARLTWTELLRDRIVLLGLFVAGGLLVLSFFLGTLTLDEQRRLLIHLGFAVFQLTLVGLSLFLGASGLQKEIDRQTCLLVLSRPVSRAQFLIGKWAGSLALLTLLWILSGALHLLMLGFAVPLGTYLAAHFTLWIESFFLLSLASFFATFLRPFLAFASALTIWLAGHWREDLIYFAKKSASSLFRDFAHAAQWIFPPLDRLQIRTLHFVEQGDASILPWPCLHLIFWSTLCLFFAQLIWRRRDLV